MKLIVCLGNPGADYQDNRHNIGFRVGESLIKEYNLTKEGNKFKSILFKGTIKETPLFLLFPQTYMNLSGEAVQLIQHFYQIELKDMLVIYDDVDIPFETIRYREKGSAGTHNGMKSIIQNLQDQEFPRLRIGIGPIPEKWNLSDFVLSNFNKKEKESLNQICIHSIQAIEKTFIVDQ